MGGHPDDFSGEPMNSGGHGENDGERAAGFCSSLDLATIPRESDHTSNGRGNNQARRGTFPNGRGGSRGAGRYSLAGGCGNSTPANYMSSNKYYSLMANGEFDIDGCGESEASEMDIQPPSGAIVTTPSCIEGRSDCQIIEFQG